MLRSMTTALMLAVAAPAAAQDLRLFTVGSGEVGGGYFEATNAICDALNRARRGDLRCSPEATPGSLYNLSALRDRQVDFALVQSDWQRSAYEGTDSFAGTEPMTDLRSVMSLYPEAVTLLASAESGIAKLTDVPGKRIDVGHPASGRHATVMRLIGALGLGRADFAALLELQAGGAVDELCAGRIDATVLIVGHPNATVARAIETCGAVLIPFRGPLVELRFWQEHGLRGDNDPFRHLSDPRHRDPDLRRHGDRRHPQCGATGHRRGTGRRDLGGPA